jgi:hypothetical protein
MFNKDFAAQNHSSAEVPNSATQSLRQRKLTALLFNDAFDSLQIKASPLLIL